MEVADHAMGLALARCTVFLLAGAADPAHRRPDFLGVVGVSRIAA
jgi:hypothetical protein